MKWMIVVLVLFVGFVGGCSAPPWSEKQIERMEVHRIDCVPLVILGEENEM